MIFKDNLFNCLVAINPILNSDKHMDSIISQMLKLLAICSIYQHCTKHILFRHTFYYYKCCLLCA